jgi:hypothetical protein
MSIRTFRHLTRRSRKALPVRKRSKYNNTILTTGEGRFDSKKEYGEWCRLKLLRDKGVISDLRRQVIIPLVVNGHKVCTYIADFQYTMDGQTVIADAKGKRTAVYILKRKLLHALTGIWIKEL